MVAEYKTIKKKSRVSNWFSAVKEKLKIVLFCLIFLWQIIVLVKNWYQ